MKQNENISEQKSQEQIKKEEFTQMKRDLTIEMTIRMVIVLEEKDAML